HGEPARSVARHPRISKIFLGRRAWLRPAPSTAAAGVPVPSSVPLYSYSAHLRLPSLSGLAKHWVGTNRQRCKGESRPLPTSRGHQDSGCSFSGGLLLAKLGTPARIAGEETGSALVEQSVTLARTAPHQPCSSGDVRGCLCPQFVLPSERYGTGPGDRVRFPDYVCRGPPQGWAGLTGRHPAGFGCCHWISLGCAAHRHPARLHVVIALGQ